MLDNASYYGRIFARSGGLSDAVAQALKEQDIMDFEAKTVACDGIEACRMALAESEPRTCCPTTLSRAWPASAAVSAAPAV